ncbi:MAG: AAA family ATPase [Marinilabiliaceae bacterium]|nr:AAA family ATPase [Marinilabiliaceae bacterium]
MKTPKYLITPDSLTIPLPNATDAEQVLLGALLLEPEAYDRVSGVISPESFYNNKNAVIYATIRHLKRSGQPVDLITVTNQLTSNGAEVTPYDLVELTSRVASAGHIETHAAIIAEKKIRRDYILKAYEVIQLASSSSELEEVVTAWDQHGKTTAEQLATDAPKEIKELLPTVLEEVRAKSNGDVIGLTTGFPTLDTHLGGLVGGRVYIIGGRPGQGKTSVALNMAVHNAMSGVNCLFVSLEQTAIDLAAKVLAGQANIGHGTLERGELNSTQWQNLDLGVGRLCSAKGKLHVSDKLKNIEHLAAIVRKSKKCNGLGLVVVDYLQLIPSTTKGTVREQEIATISRAIKLLAMAENLPIIALSQLNREAKGEPRLNQLRESGSLEQDADVVLLVYRPSLDGDESARADYGELIVAKNRRGTLGRLPCYHRNMSEFSEYPFDNAF